MKLDDTKHEQWLAYLLGELEQDEAARVEVEMANAPEKAQAFKERLVQVRAWTKEPVEHTPLNTDAFFPETATPLTRSHWARQWPWAVAAGLVLIALTQLSVSLTVGNTSLAWGTPAQDSEDAALAQHAEELEGRLKTLESAAIESTNLLRRTTFKISTLEQGLVRATEQLALNQQAETRARYADVQRILELTGHRDLALASWMDPNTP